MKIKKHLLYKGDKQVTHVVTPHMSAGLKVPRFIIIHYTSSSTFMSGVYWHSDPKSKVSADIHLGRAGEIIQMAPFNRITWHAGASSWKGLTGLNKYSIGIELQNTGTQEYTKVQLSELVEMCKAMIEAYPTIEDILGHNQIAPTRKVDPGPQFPMAWVKEQVFGQAVDDVKTTTPSGLNLRSSPSTAGKILATLPKGTQVKILSVQGGWSNVFVSSLNLKGWVSNSYIL